MDRKPPVVGLYGAAPDTKVHHRRVAANLANGGADKFERFNHISKAGGIRGKFIMDRIPFLGLAAKRLTLVDIPPTNQIGTVPLAVPTVNLALRRVDLDGALKWR